MSEASPCDFLTLFGFGESGSKTSHSMNRLTLKGSKLTPPMMRQHSRSASLSLPDAGESANEGSHLMHKSTHWKSRITLPACGKLSRWGFVLLPDLLQTDTGSHAVNDLASGRPKDHSLHWASLGAWPPYRFQICGSLILKRAGRLGN